VSLDGQSLPYSQFELDSVVRIVGATVVDNDETKQRELDYWLINPVMLPHSFMRIGVQHNIE
jgi:hypothetical protein